MTGHVYMIINSYLNKWMCLLALIIILKLIIIRIDSANIILPMDEQWVSWKILLIWEILDQM